VKAFGIFQAGREECGQERAAGSGRMGIQFQPFVDTHMMHAGLELGDIEKN
jgi:hypothetical protein